MERRSLFAGPTAVVMMVGAALSGLVQACGEEDENPPPGGYTAAGTASDQGGEAGAMSGGNGGRGGSAGRGGSGGSAATGGDGGSSGEGGAPPASGGAAASGGASASGGTAGTGGGDAGQGGVPPEPSIDCPPEPTSGDPPASTPVCDIEAVWGAGERVPVPTTGNDVLLSVTPDELTLAWASVDVFSRAFLVADRALVSADFGAPVQLTEPTLAGADQLALSPDGLRLVAVVSGRLLEAIRAARGEAFDPPAERSFALLNADADSGGTSLRDPVIAPDDLSLYYTLAGSSDDTLRVSSRTGSEPWPVGRALGECEFKTLAGSGRIPTGISSDGLTLFYFDNPRRTTRAAFRPALDWPFLDFVDLGDRSTAQPNAACDRLYYSGPGEFPVELLVSAPE